MELPTAAKMRTNFFIRGLYSLALQRKAKNRKVWGSGGPQTPALFG